MRYPNIGAPVNAVIIPTGISAEEALLATESAINRKRPPIRAVTGIILSCVGPVTVLAIWGIISPIQHICPQVATEAATMNELAVIRIILKKEGFIPRDFAWISPRERILSLNLKMMNRTNPENVNNAITNTLFQVSGTQALRPSLVQHRFVGFVIRSPVISTIQLSIREWMIWLNRFLQAPMV
jgi:hypothetical protein